MGVLFAFEKFFYFGVREMYIGFATLTIEGFVPQNSTDERSILYAKDFKEA